MVRLNDDLPRLLPVNRFHNPAAIKSPCPQLDRGFEHQPQICFRKPSIQHAIQDVATQFQFEAPPIRRILHGYVSGLDSLCLAATFRIIQLVATDVTCVGQCGDPYSLDDAAGVDGETANGKLKTYRHWGGDKGHGRMVAANRTCTYNSEQVTQRPEEILT
jgi:hypothetical protein